MPLRAYRAKRKQIAHSGTQTWTTEEVEAEIVQQMEWTFDALNLQHDAFLQSFMDEDMWVPVEALLHFPRFQTMGVTDAQAVHELLREQCDTVIVHPTLPFVRPRWARPPWLSAVLAFPCMESGLRCLLMPRSGMDSLYDVCKWYAVADLSSVDFLHRHTDCTSLSQVGADSSGVSHVGAINRNFDDRRELGPLELDKLFYNID